MGSIPSVKALRLSSSSPRTRVCPSPDASGDDGARLSTELRIAIDPHALLITWLQKKPGKLGSWIVDRRGQMDELGAGRRWGLWVY